MGAVHWLIPSEKAKITSLYKMSENEEKSGKKDGAPSAVPQLLSAIALSFGSTIAGGWMSFSSVAIPKMMKTVNDDLEEVTDDIQIDLHTGAWIASLFFFGNIIGCLLGGFINQKNWVSTSISLLSTLSMHHLGHDSPHQPYPGYSGVKGFSRGGVWSISSQRQGVQCRDSSP